jgi:hypothetical protein
MPSATTPVSMKMHRIPWRPNNRQPLARRASLSRGRRPFPIKRKVISDDICRIRTRPSARYPCCPCLPQAHRGLCREPQTCRLGRHSGRACRGARTRLPWRSKPLAFRERSSNAPKRRNSTAADAIGVLPSMRIGRLLPKCFDQAFPSRRFSIIACTDCPNTDIVGLNVIGHYPRA